MSQPATIQAAINPGHGRLGIIDAIRGLAILGILFANIQSWSGYLFTPFTQMQNLPLAELDGLFYSLHKILIDGKFYSIFSLLFGVGFALQFNKNEQRQQDFIPVYKRRLCFLLLFGLCHTLIWSGDILTLYALLAFVMVSLRNFSTQAVLILAVSLLLWFLVPHSIAIVQGWNPLTLDNTAAIARKVYPDQAPASVVSAYGFGNIQQVFIQNLHNIYWRWVDMLPNGRISRVLGLFLLGFYLGRTGYFHKNIYKLKYLFIYSVIGCSSMAASYILETNMYHWAQQPQDLFSKSLSVLAQVFMALMYMSLLAQVYRSKIGQTLLFPLTEIGRMAFTNYLLHTVIGISLFYGIGLGYFSQLSLAALWLLAALIFTLQVLASTFWLKAFKQGPIEWLWGCLTKGELSANKR